MNRTDAARRRAEQLRRARMQGRNASPGEDRAMARLVICGVVFVVLVAIKLLFPQAVDGIAQSAGQLIGRDADFKEAFAAMGRAISGEAGVGDSLQDAYTAVFNPASRPAVTAEQEEMEAKAEKAAMPVNGDFIAQQVVAAAPVGMQETVVLVEMYIG